MISAIAVGGGGSAASAQEEGGPDIAGDWVKLDGDWMTRTGTGTDWAELEIDSAGWRTVFLPTSWNEARYDGVDGPIWFRRSVSLPASWASTTTPRALLIESMWYRRLRVWVNGDLVGEHVPRFLRPLDPTDRVFELAGVGSGGNQEMQVTIEVDRIGWAADHLSAAQEPLADPILLGEVDAVYARSELDHLRVMSRAWPILIVAAVFMIGALLHLTLFVLRPAQRPYLWFALLSVGFAANLLLASMWPHLIAIPVSVSERLLASSGHLIAIAGAQFLWTHLAVPMDRWVRTLRGLHVLLAAFALLSPSMAFVLSTETLRLVLLAPLMIAALWLVATEAMRGNRAARIVLVGVVAMVTVELGVIVANVRGIQIAAIVPAGSFSILLAAMAGSLALNFDATVRELDHVRQELEHTIERRGEDLARTRAALQDVEARANFLQSQRIETVGQLAGGIAHDFNNILSSILGYGELLAKESESTPTQREYTRRIVCAALRARDLVSRILTFSRSVRPERKTLSLQGAIDEAVTLLRGSFPATIQIETKIDQTCGAVLADSTQVNQILMNLGTNAQRAMAENRGTLAIELSNVRIAPDQGAAVPSPEGLPAGEYARLSVTDDGVGMTPEVQLRVFDPFFTTAEGGTGLGMSVVHGIVHSHEGAIEVKSAPGQGTRVDVYLPIAREEPVEAAPLDHLDGSKVQGLRVLLVDDEPPIVDLIRIMLEEFGHSVETHVTAADALSSLGSDPTRFDLVVTDGTMPAMTGMELARRVREIRPGLPVILQTGYGSGMDPDVAAEAGIRGLLRKPFRQQELGAEILRIFSPAPQT